MSETEARALTPKPRSYTLDQLNVEQMFVSKSKKVERIQY